MFDEKTQNIEVFVIPTFEDICLNRPLILNVIDGVTVKDVRCIYEATRNGHMEIVEVFKTEYYVITPRYEHMVQKLFFDNKKEIMDCIKYNKKNECVELGLIKIMRTAWNDNSSVVNFLKQITDKEKGMLEYLVAKIGNEGLIVQEKMASDLKLSRVFVTRFFEKMELAQVAQIERRGSAGTYISFIDDTLLDIRGFM